MNLDIGTRLGPYEIAALLGAGGRGEVYRAIDTRLDRSVAIKILLDDLASDTGRRADLVREARAVAQLNHPHIRALYDIGRDAGFDFLVLEYLEGETLAERLTHGGLPAAEAIAHAVAIADALDHAHRSGVIHRDLKSSNIVITTGGVVKVMDFGLAARLRRDEIEEATRSAYSIEEAGIVAGTLPYMAPEGLRGEPATSVTDIWSFGVLLFEMTAGRRPFSAHTAVELTTSILRDPPAPLPSAVPEALSSVILRCLQKEPAKRFQAAGQLRDALSAMHGGAGEAAPAERPAAAAQTTRPVRSRRAGRIRSLAVLPLDDLSPAAGADYFADGLTEALIADLAHIGDVRVISRTSVMRYKGVRKPLQEIASELNVDAVIEGSVVRAGRRVRITVQLIDARKDAHLWARSFERDLEDILSLQGEVAREVAAGIRAKLTPAQAARLSQSRRVDAEAYQAYLKGRYHWNRRPVGLRAGIEFFEQAIAQDPSFAAAYVGLADSYAIAGSWESGVLPPADAMPRAKAAAERALELEPTLGEAHASLGYVALHHEWDWPGAERAFKTAFRLKPNYAHAHHWYAHCLLATGRTEEALAESRLIIEMDPLDPVINAHLAWHYYFAREYEPAITQARKTRELDRNVFWAPFFAGLALEGQGRFAEAIAELERAVVASGETTCAIAALGHACARAGDLHAAREHLDRLNALESERYVSAYDRAIVSTGLREHDEAIRWLEQAEQERSGWIAYLRLEPRLDPLRSDPRFEALLLRAGHR